MRIKRTRCLAMALLLMTSILMLSCATSVSSSSLTESMLYDPYSVHLKEGVKYEFEEGYMIGRKDHQLFSLKAYYEAAYDR